ncbi:MAG: alpha/beta hydrolase [Polaromonas sp.]|nr:alpha/beta hydrolase [Polaromonas sp.]
MTQPSLNYVFCPDAAGGHRMAYWQWGRPGSEHVVLCVHGLTRQGRDFDVLAQALCERADSLPGFPDGIRVICPDVVGRGESDWLKDPAGYQIPSYAADMLALLAQLQAQAPIKTLDWVGTSMGGLIGMLVCAQPVLHTAGAAPHEVAAPGGDAAALSLPLPVRKLVLNDVGPALQAKAIARIGAYIGKAGHFNTLQEAADAMWEICQSFGPHTPEQWLALVRPMLKPVSPGADSPMRLHYDPAIALPFKAATQDAAQQGEAMLWRLYEQIKAQTLLLRGAQSDLLSLETAQAMTQRGPHAQLIEFDGVGHAPTLIADDQVAAVARFLLA